MSDVETKLAAARTRLILEKPFLGALVLRLPMVAADAKWCRTSGTDARKLYYNADYIDAINIDQVQFVLAHEALHCALSHFARRQHRNRHRWDVACDQAINPLLLSDGLTPPPGVWVDKGFEGMTAEEIYPCIDENTADEPMDQHIYDGESEGSSNNSQGADSNDSSQSDPNDDGSGAGQQADDNQGGNEQQNGAAAPPPLTRAERDTLDIQWQQRMAGAAQQALQAGKLGGALARMIDHLLQPQLPWRMLLARYMTTVARDDYTYMRPSRREGSAILPTLRSSQLDVVIALDTSGSIKPAELEEFASEIDAIKGQMRARLTLLACDATLAENGPWIYEPWETFALPRQFKGGGGGTNFNPVFAWATQQDSPPDLLVYFTDGEGKFPAAEPAFPVLWLITGKTGVPWGQRIQLN